MSPYQLVFEKVCHLPIVLEYKVLQALKKLNLNRDEASKERVNQLHEMEELRLRAYESSTLYKERMKIWHDDKILKWEFKEGNSVFLYNSRLLLFPGKLKSNWSGPFRVVHAFPNRAIEI